ncbi:hypothetical protein ACN47E_004888 [Coniothyrium glycines]
MENSHSEVLLQQSAEDKAIPASSNTSFEVRPMAAALPTPLVAHDFRPSSTGLRLDDQDQMCWAGANSFALPNTVHQPALIHMSIPFQDSGTVSYAQSENGMSYNNNYDLRFSNQYDDPTYSQSYVRPEQHDVINEDDMSDAYPPAAYQFEPHQQCDSMDLSDIDIKGQLMQMSNDYEQYHYELQAQKEDLFGYRSPYSDLTRASTPSASGCEDTAIDKEQPYAQLIYHALMNAPEKTMILRDIYEWFKQNTDKANGSETKGWQNSIRHNLSMNGAFEKVDQPCEDSRKGFMWRLTEEAIRDGVKSTTRYRSKQPNKRGHRVQPLPQRQASGAKGGQAARRSAKVRRSHRMHDNMHMSRSVPSAFDPVYDNSDTSMAYPPSPYYGSEADFAYSIKPPNPGNPYPGSQPTMFTTQRSYMGTPLSHGLPVHDTAFLIDHSPEGSLYTDSPSPEADSLPTPTNQHIWNDDISLGAPFVFDEIAYRDYAG